MQRDACKISSEIAITVAISKKESSPLESLLVLNVLVKGDISVLSVFLLLTKLYLLYAMLFM